MSGNCKGDCRTLGACRGSISLGRRDCCEEMWQRLISARFAELALNARACRKPTKLVMGWQSMFETDRLNLRQWRLGDQQALDAIFGDPEVMQFSDHGILSRADRVAWLEQAIECAGHGKLPWSFAVERKQDHEVIGYISLSSDLSRVEHVDAEIGFRLARRAWGQGLTTEAAHWIIQAARARPEIERIVAIVDPNNVGSVRVLGKLGMTRVGDVLLSGYDYPDHLYAKSIRSEG